MNSLRKDEKKKKENPLPGILALIGVGLFTFASGWTLILLLLILLLCAGLGWFAYRMGKKHKVGTGAKDLVRAVTRHRDEEEAEDGYCKTCSDEFVYNNRQAQYNENTQEECLLRERQRRVQQLDSFLKNGIIDRKEYQLLRSRYEKDR